MSKEILLDLIDLQDRYVIAHTLCEIHLNEDNKFQVKLDYGNLYYICGKVGLEEHEWQESLEIDDWDSLLRKENAKEGTYWIYMMYSICSDGDDYHSWNYYELETIELNLCCLLSDKKIDIETKDDELFF